MATRKAPPRKRGATTSQKRRQAPKQTRGGIPGWLWAAVGVVAGFLLAHHQNGTAPWQDPRSPVAAVLPKPSSGEQQGSNASGSAQGGQASESEPPMPTFEFYTLLPESEVIASDEEMQRMWILRKLLNPMDATAATEFLIDRLKDTKTNLEFFEAMKRR